MVLRSSDSCTQGLFSFLASSKPLLREAQNPPPSMTFVAPPSSYAFLSPAATIHVGEQPLRVDSILTTLPGRRALMTQKKKSLQRSSFALHDFLRRASPALVSSANSAWPSLMRCAGERVSSSLSLADDIFVSCGGRFRLLRTCAGDSAAARL